MRLGIDWGGTKLEIIALDDDGRELMRRRTGTPQHDYEGCIEAARDLVAGAEAELGREGTVGVGIPGAISLRTGLVKNANSVWLIGKPLGEDLAMATGRPVRVENDADCFTLSEAVDGAGADANLVFGVILGTGVGGGVAVRRDVRPGPNLIRGEWGHNQLPWPEPDELPGPLCYCGRHGCIERWVAGPGMADDHFRATGETLRAEAIMARKEEGDAAAAATYARYLSRLARSLAHVVNLLDPDVIVLGGGMGRIATLYDELPGAMRPFIFSDGFDTPIRPPLHGDSSGVRGAAWLWNDDPPG